MSVNIVLLTLSVLFCLMPYSLYPTLENCIFSLFPYSSCHHTFTLMSAPCVRHAPYDVLYFLHCPCGITSAPRGMLSAPYGVLLSAACDVTFMKVMRKAGELPPLSEARPGISGLARNLVRIAQNRTNLGYFQIRFHNILT